MKKLLLAGVALMVVGVLAYTPAFTQTVDQTKSGAPSSAAPSPAPESAAPKSATSERAAPKSAAAKSSVSKKTSVRIDPADGRPLSPKSAASRIALCKADCRPGHYNQSSGIGVHGIYRSYATFDPNLSSAEGQASFAECVKKCSDPLPAVYIQRAVFGAGINYWFGMTKETCLNCHAKGH